MSTQQTDKSASAISPMFVSGRPTPRSELAAAAVATGSAVSSEHGGVSRSGHAGWYRCVRRIGRGHGAAGASRGVPPKKSSPRRLGTTHESALSLSDASSLTSDREARSVGRAYTTNETPRDTRRGARRLDAFDSTPGTTPDCLLAPEKHGLRGVPRNRNKKNSPCTRCTSMMIHMCVSYRIIKYMCGSNCNSIFIHVCSCTHVCIYASIYVCVSMLAYMYVSKHV